MNLQVDNPIFDESIETTGTGPTQWKIKHSCCCCGPYVDVYVPNKKTRHFLRHWECQPAVPIMVTILAVFCLFVYFFAVEPYDSSMLGESENNDVNDLIVASSFSIAPTHHFTFEMIEINNNSGPFIIYLDQTDQVDSIQNVNVINCQLESEKKENSEAILYLTQGTTIIKNWGFIFNEENLNQIYNSNNPLTLLYTPDESSLTLQNCFFSLPSSSILTSNPQLTIESSVQFAASNIPAIKIIKSEGCWNQNRFKFREPKTYQKVIISIVVILVFVIGFIFMIVEACQDEKKHKELLQLQEFNEMQNEALQQNARNQIDDEEELKQKSEMSHPSLMKTNYGNDGKEKDKNDVSESKTLNISEAKSNDEKEGK